MTQVVKDFHKYPSRADMEKVKKLLKDHFGVNAEIKARYRKAFHLRDFFVMTTKALDAKLVVELGTGGGSSCTAFTTALKETNGILYSVDKYRDNSPSGVRVKNTIQKFTHEKSPVIFIHGDSVEVGKKWDKGSIDILYVDSDHHYQHVVDELEVWTRFDPKIIFFHDTLVRGNEIHEPYYAAKEYAERHGKLFVNLTFGVGLGIII